MQYCKMCDFVDLCLYSRRPEDYVSENKKKIVRLLDATTENLFMEKNYDEILLL